MGASGTDMAVTINAAYTPVDLVDGAGCAPGTQILAAPLQTVAGNHNFLGATYRPPVVKWCHPTGVASGTAAQQNVLIFGVPRNIDDPDYTIKIRASNASGSGTRVYAILASAAGSTSAYASLAGSASSSDLSITLDTSVITGSGGMLFISTLHNGVTIHDLLIYPASEHGSVADTPKASGFRYAQSAELAATEPITVEMMNRLLEAPRAMFNTHLGQAFCFADNLTTAVGSGTWKTTRNVDTLLNRNFVDVRLSQIDITWIVYAIGPAGSKVRITMTPVSVAGTVSHTLILSTSTTALPTNPSGTYTLISGSTTGVESGLYQVDVWGLSGSDGSAVQVYSVSGVQSV